MNFNLRLTYLYLVSFIALIICVIASVQLIDLGLKAFVFKDADKFEYYSAPLKDEQSQYDAEQAKLTSEREQSRSRQRTASNAIAMIIIGLPLYVYHWKVIQKESRSLS